MEAVIVYLWVDICEMNACLDWKSQGRKPGCPPVHVSLQNPTEDEASLSIEEDTMEESKNTMLLKRKIYLLPPYLHLSRSNEKKDVIYYEDEVCDLVWDAQKSTVAAKCAYGLLSLLPSD